MISLAAAMTRSGLNGFSIKTCPGILIMTSPGLPVMKSAGTGRSEQIDWTASIPQPGLSWTSAVMRSGQLRAAAATASSFEAAKSNEVKPQARSAAGGRNQDPGL